MRERQVEWDNTFRVDIPDSTYSQRFDLDMHLDYYRWRHDGKDQYAVFGMVGCYTAYQGGAQGPFGGLKVNLDYGDANEHKSPPTWVIPGNNGTVRKCEPFEIDPSNRIWLESGQGPWWAIHGSFIYGGGLHDVKFRMRVSATDISRTIRPDDDPQDQPIAWVTVHTTTGNIQEAN